MENYTKYALKSVDELAPVIAEANNIFVIACNKCFKEFENTNETDCEAFEKIVAEQGKTVTGSAKVDFLCNKTQTVKKFDDMIPEGTESIFVVSCGLGIQTVAEMADVPVFAACNSLNYTGHHGMALTKKACDACAQCYLNMTGGISQSLKTLGYCNVLFDAFGLCLQIFEQSLRIGNGSIGTDTDATCVKIVIRRDIHLLLDKPYKLRQCQRAAQKEY